MTYTNNSRLESIPEDERREFLFYRIDAGFLLYNTENLKLKIKPPTKELLYESSFVYEQIYNQADYLPSHLETILLLRESGRWTEQNDHDYKQLPDNIEKLKLELYQSNFKSVTQEKLRKYLSISKEEYERLNSIYYSLYSYSREGIASLSRWNYIIENSTFDMNNNKYNWSDISVDRIVKYYNNNTISNSLIRDLAHSNMWMQIFSTRSMNNVNVFDGHLTTEQMCLLSWTKFYQSIYESHECPPEIIINDDDLIDGWVIYYRKKREGEQKKNYTSNFINTNSKIGQAQEVFIPAQTQEDAQKIYELNNMHGKAVVGSRINKVTKENVVRIENMPDVRRKIQMEYTNMQANQGKDK